MIQPLAQISAPMQALSSYIAEAATLPLPPEVMERAALHALDTLAAMISGARLAPGRAALDFIAGEGGTREASVPGSRIVTTAINAALAGGMLAHADETDDSHAPSRTHPGCAVLPAALAAAERADAGGTALLRALVLGYDVGARLMYALGAEGFAAAARGTHSFGGCFGAGAAAAALLELDARQVRHALSFCAQQASGIGASVRDADHMEKSFDFGGMPARNGITAALLAAAGFTGVDDVFAGERNFFDAFAAEPNPGLLAEELGRRFEILGTNIKKWSVGSPAQSALDALQQLMSAHDLAPDKVVAIELQLPTRSARTVDEAPMPDVNVQHLMAMLLIDGTLGFDSVHDHDRMRDPAIIDVKRRIRLVPSEELMQARPRRQAIVTVTLAGGGMLTHRTYAVRGSADNPMDRDEVEAKARDLMLPVLGKGRTGRLIEALRGLPEIDDVVTLRPLWQASLK